MFTRFQTLKIQPLGGDLQKCVISYGTRQPILFVIKADTLINSLGSCQFPTLGFVVDRYFRVKNFVPEKFWSIKIVQLRDDVTVTFSWRRNRLFNRTAVIILFERCLTARMAKITKLQKRPTSKWRPLPLTTVELQKLGSRFLRMNSQEVMKVSISVIV